jgi:hypothetical protein
MPIEQTDDNRAAISPDNAADGAPAVEFLRRLSSVISVGQNAAHLDYAAALIELLSSRAADAERALREQKDATATHVALCRDYELMIERQKSEVAALQATLDRKAQDGVRERGEFGREIERLKAAIEQAELERIIIADDLETTRTRLAGLAEASVIAPAATLHALRAQFDSLAGEFVKRGDLISQVMSDIGRCTIDQVLAQATRPVPAGERDPGAAAAAAAGELVKVDADAWAA